MNKPLLLAVFASLFLACGYKCPTNTGYYYLHWSQQGNCPGIDDSVQKVGLGAVMISPGSCAVEQATINDNKCSGVFDIVCDEAFETVVVRYHARSRDFQETVHFDGNWNGLECAGDFQLEATFLHR